MRRISIRQARFEDIDQIMRVEDRAWPKSCQATEEMFISRVKTFPEGVMVADVAGECRGVVVAQILKDYDLDNPISTWQQATDGGYLRNTHSPDGDILYGVDLSVDPDFENLGIGTSLLCRVGILVIKYNLKAGVLGGRIPLYYRYAHKVSIEDYLKMTTESGESFDPELRFYKKAGLEIVRILPDYFQDSQSLNYGVLLLWRNPVWVNNRILGVVIGRTLAFLLRLSPRLLFRLSSLIR